MLTEIFFSLQFMGNSTSDSREKEEITWSGRDMTGHSKFIVTNLLSNSYLVPHMPQSK